MTEVAAILLTAILLILMVILAVLAGFLFLLYRVHQKIQIIEETQDVIFSAATNSEEYFNSIIEGERFTINSN